MLGGVFYIAEKVAQRVANRAKWLLGGLHFFET
jgi:metal-dependent hydrolase (beta-lactamase superfamily II)